MKKNILVIYYSQTEQLEDIVKNIADLLKLKRRNMMLPIIILN